MDQIDVNRAFVDLRTHGIELCAVFHSQPKTPPVPSRINLMEASFPGALLVTIGLMPTETIRGWRLVVGQTAKVVQATELPLSIGEHPFGSSVRRTSEPKKQRVEGR
jgi:hypothetical protein